MDKDKIIKDAQYRKGLSIAFFNATNSAIALVVENMPPKIEDALEEVKKVRDFFLEEHKNYYANTIANVGLYKKETSIERLNKAKSLEELKNIWVSLSADERDDEAIIKIKDSIKKKYEKA